MQNRSKNLRVGHAWRSPLIFHICFISSSDTFQCALKIPSAYFHQLTFSVTLHMSSIIIFSPSLSQPTSLPPGSPSLFLFSIICQPFALAIKNVLGEPGRLLSLCVRADIHRCSIYGACVSTDRRWVNAIKRWWKQNRQKNIRESAW